MTRLPKSAHTSRPWRIHEVIPDFRVEDVWALPASGTRAEFAQLVDGFATADFSGPASLPARALFALRWKLGELLGWDGEGDGIGARVPSLRDRLPDDLREGPAGPAFDGYPFDSLYLLEDEWAAEIANKTMHGVLHLGWVPDGSGRYRGQLAVLVRTNGRFGDAYMAAIKPFRYLIVYPALMREIERRWTYAANATPSASA